MFGAFKRHEKPNEELVTEAAYTLVGRHTEDSRALARDRKVQEIFEYHEAKVGRKIITEAIETKYDELQGEPAEDTEPAAERDA